MVRGGGRGAKEARERKGARADATHIKTLSPQPEDRTQGPPPKTPARRRPGLGFRSLSPLSDTAGSGRRTAARRSVSHNDAGAGGGKREGWGAWCWQCAGERVHNGGLSERRTVNWGWRQGGERICDARRFERRSTAKGRRLTGRRVLEARSRGGSGHDDEGEGILVGGGGKRVVHGVDL